MDTFAPNKSSNSKVRPSQIFGGFDEIGFELETPSVASVAKGIGEGASDIFSLFKDIAGVEGKSPETQAETNKLTIGGQTELKFNENKAKLEEQDKNRKEADRKKTFYQTLKDDVLRAQMAKDRVWMEEEIDDLTTNMSTEEKNELLHYQASYKDRSIYQKAELRRKIIEQRRKSEKQTKDASIPSPAKQASALQTAFEGGSGSQGGGTANLSAQATG